MPANDSRKALGFQSLLFAVSGSLFLFALYREAVSWWPGATPARWLLFALFSHAYFTVVLFRNLAANRRKHETAILPSIGWANALTLLRAVLMSAVVGFLFSPRPAAGAAWMPGLLYVAASLPDYIDGIVARKTNHATELGEILDMNVDSVGVFTATFLAFQYGVIPWWYVPIGLARYIFVGAIRIREKAGRPVHALAYSHRRRGFAALKMGFMFVMLFPLFTPPGTYVAAAAFGLPFLGGFVWDWLAVSGALTAERRAEIKAAWSGFFGLAPLVVRALCVSLALSHALDHVAAPETAVLGYAELAVTLLIGFGIAPRAAAIAAVCLVGVNQNISPLGLDQYILAAAYIQMIFLGSGAFSLLPVEDYLIYHRIGDPV